MLISGILPEWFLAALNGTTGLIIELFWIDRSLLALRKCKQVATAERHRVFHVSIHLRDVRRILWLNRRGILCTVKPISYLVLQAVRVNQCHYPLIRSRQLLQNVAAGACYYGDGVIVNFQPSWQTVEPY